MKRFHVWSLPLLAAMATPALSQATDSAIVAASPTAAVSFQIFLPLRNEAALDKLLKDQQTLGSPSYHKWLTPSEFGQRFGPSSETIEAAKTAIQKTGLSVTNVGTTSLDVSGTVGGVNKLLGTSLGNLKGADGNVRLVAMSKTTMLPELEATGATVVAFTTVPPHHPFVTRANAKMLPSNRYSPYGAYWFTDLKQAYDYPAYNTKVKGGILDGTGVSAAILMAGQLYKDDLPAFFGEENFVANGGKAIPTVTTVKINGGGTKSDDASFEAALDVQQVTGGAPGVDMTFVNVPTLSDDNIMKGYQYIVDQNKYDVVSSSFGECELFYTAAYNNGKDETKVLMQYDKLFKQGNAEGITFLASSGDNGGLECTDTKYLSGSSKGKFIKGVSTPAASAYVTAVGGGNLETTTGKNKKDLQSAYVGENGQGDPLVPYDPYGIGGGAAASGGYWGAGGGISTIFAAPDYQQQKNINTGSTKFRTVPDIGMQVGGCPGIAKAADDTPPCGGTTSAAVLAYDVDDTTNGGFFGVIGTSVSSPELASAVVLYVQSQGGGGAKGKGRQGNLNPFLYAQGAAQTKAGGIKAPAKSQFYHRNIPGFDGVYKDSDPSDNYNYIVGNGTPDVRVLFGFSGTQPAGVPQTATNP